jgi:hypothetical protein
MPPAPTQNLNAKLTVSGAAGRTAGGRGIRAPRVPASAPPVRIMGASSGYRGGYRVER